MSCSGHKIQSRHEVNFETQPKIIFYKISGSDAFYRGEVGVLCKDYRDQILIFTLYPYYDWVFPEWVFLNFQIETL